jgi:tRNA(fMet)-specific endonuclease VapC
MIPKLALDTNAYRALDDGNAKLTKLVKTSPMIGVPVTVLGELYFGIFDGSKRESNAQTLRQFLNSSRVEVLHINEDTSKIFGELSAQLKKTGKPIQQNDVWIAAICKQHGYVLATVDKGFERIVGLEVIQF